MNNKICLLTLGCSKNLVDSEKLIGQFENNGYKYTPQIRLADTLIINTCGFIKPSKEESLNIISESIELKNAGKLQKLIVMGCLSKRYKKELEEQMPEVDAFLGINDTLGVFNCLSRDLKFNLLGERHILTPKHSAYLKISEGCNHRCSFCAIPSIRGKYHSTPIESLVTEAEYLASRGVKEINVIAQDTNYYGKDLYGSQKLTELLQNLSRVNGIEWIRLLYSYPVALPEGLLDEIALNDKICKYIDVPLQHISDNILKRMGRGSNKNQIIKLIEKIRKTIPGVAIRSTFIVGFPGETDSEFLELKEFLNEIELERVGIFTYSHEENTGAYCFIDNIPEELKHERRNILMEQQQKISLKQNKAKVGSVLKVMVDSIDRDWLTGRTEQDAPEVDNSVLIELNKKYKPGHISSVLITDAKEYDLIGEFV